MLHRSISSTAVIMAVLCLSSLAAAETLTVTVEVQGERFPDSALLEAYSGDVHAEPLTASVSLATGRGGVTFELSESVEGPWHVRTLAEGFWAAEAEVTPHRGNLVHIELWPAGILRGTLRTPADGESPEELKISLTAASEVSGEMVQPEEAVTSCGVVEGSVAPCVVPAGTWHLRAKAQDYVAHYRWGLRIPAAEEIDLGRLQLKPGASLVGRVVTESGPADPEETRIELTPLVDRHTASEEERRELELLTFSERLNPWGYFHFEDVAPGSYQVVARQAGFTPAERSPVNLPRGDSVELADPLTLESPVRLVVTVTPSETPSGEPWGVTFLGQDRFSQLEVVEEGHTEAGRWISSPVASGTYSVRILSGSETPFAWEDVELVEDRQPLAVDLDLVQVDGKVVMGETPLTAELWFGGRNGPTRVSATSDEQGEFQVILPREGTWPVDVVADEPKVHAQDVEVDVETGSDRQAEILVELPDTTIRGAVVDSQGAPRDGAVVRLLQTDQEPKMATTRSHEDGSFELHGQEPGSWFIEAKAGDAKSAALEVDLVEGSTTGPVRLVVKEDQYLVGAVRGPAGAVPRALILAFPILSGGTLPAVAVPQTRSGIDGSFELGLPIDSLAARLVILAPGFSLHVERVPTDAQEPVVVQLRREGGRLTLRKASTEDAGVPLLLVDGQPLDLMKLPLLTRWAQTNGVTPDDDQVLSIPAMASGSYAYCHVSQEEALLVMAGAAQPSTQACSEGYLPPGGELELAFGG